MKAGKYDIRTRLLLVIFIYLLIEPLFFAYPGPPQFWTQPRQLSYSPAISKNPRVCSQNNQIHLVWDDNRTKNSEIFYIYSLDAGQSWSREEKLTNTNGDSTQPAIACSQNYRYVVWREEKIEGSQIYYKKWDGKNWGNAILLSGKHKNCQRPDITVTKNFPSSYVYVVWDNYEDNKTKAYITRSIDGGQTFSEPTPLVNGDWDSTEPSVFGGNRDAYVVWKDNRENRWNIYFRRWGEIQVSQESKISAIPDCHRPAIWVTEPEIYVTWQCVEKPRTYSDIYFSYSSNYGITWNNGEKITKGEAESLFPIVITLDKEPWIFWQDGQNSQWQIFSWSLDAENPIPLTESDKPAMFPYSTITPGQIHLFWTRQENSSKSSIMYIRRDTIPPGRPGTPFHFDLTSEPGYDDDNHVTFVWDNPSKSSIDGLIKYNVYSKEDNGEFTLAGNTDKTSFDIQGKSGKVYQIYVEALDEVGNLSPRSGVSPKILCDSEPPIIYIHSPGPNSTIRGDIPIIASVNDSNFLEYTLEYGATSTPLSWRRLIEPSKIEADRERIATWETSNLNGIYSLRISARDKAGNESRKVILVNIDSEKPSLIDYGQVIQLSDSEWNYGTPTWSPKGESIAFYSNKGGTQDIWTINLNSKVYTRLTQSRTMDSNPSWSHNGDYIAFQSFTEDDLWDIWIVKTDGKDVKKILGGESSDEEPAWSPDGSSMAFSSDQNGDREIFLITNMQDVLGGSEAKVIQLTENNWDDRHPTWSPDGSRIAFQSFRRGNWGLYEIGIDGKNFGLVFDSPADEIEPEWSPDRKRLLFSTSESGSYYEIRAIDWPGASNEISLSSKGQNARHASWSPDMNSMVFESNGLLYLTTIEYPEEDIEALISWPRSGEFIKGQVDIIGKARGRNFRSYTLMYARYNELAFQIIDGESTAPVPKPGFLGRWNIESLNGDYQLKLIVTGKDGKYVEDSIRVFIESQMPYVLIDEPQNNLYTNQNIVSIKGQTENNVILSLNEVEFYPSVDGSFVRKVQLSEGANKLVIKARDTLIQRGEYIVERTVFLDTKPPVITLESPKDFQIVNVPYVTVKGVVNEESEISILSKRVWPDNRGEFQQKVLCKEGMNLISIMAFDKLGHLTSIERRVIFQKKSDILSDTLPPVITEAFPENRAVVTGQSLQISATLVDDVGLDPYSITFTYNNKEIDKEEYSLDIKLPDGYKVFPLDRYPIIHFSYSPTPPLSQGQHTFKIKVSDTSGNTGESTFSFFSEPDPLRVLLSAQLVNKEKQLKVMIASNRQLSQIKKFNIYKGSGQLGGYSLWSFNKKDDYLESYLDISASQQSFIMEFVGETYIGEKANARGYFAWNRGKYGKTLEIGCAGCPRFLSNPLNYSGDDLIMSISSQDGISDGKFHKQLLDKQQRDALDRRLKNSGLVYIVSASKEIKNGSLQGSLSLPIYKPDYESKRIVMFQWDEDLDQWKPLDRLGISGSSVESQIPGPGIYTLFADLEPPIVENIFPSDFGEIPLEKFYMEANIRDNGSGIAQIKLLVDGKSVDFDYIQNRLIYSPINLEWGLHRVEIIATDRAGNVRNFVTNFTTQDTFQFVSTRVYPNPASKNANVEFKLTKVGNVILRIYNLAGELIYKHETNKAEGKLTWKLENEYGRKVASGIYVYSMEASLNNTRIRKQGIIAVVK